MKLSLAKFPQVVKVYYLNLNKSANAWQALCTQVLPAALLHPPRYLLGSRARQKAHVGAGFLQRRSLLLEVPSNLPAEGLPSLTQ